MENKRTRGLTMRLIRLFLVSFAPSIWFNDIFVTILEYALEDDRPMEVCETSVAVPAERSVWEFAAMPEDD